MCEMCDLDGGRRFDRRAMLRRAAVLGGAAMVGPQLLGALGSPAAAFETDDMGEDEPLFGAAQSSSSEAGYRIAAARFGVVPPGIVTRAQWGADESLRSGTPDFKAIRKLVVHHTVTPNGADPYGQARAVHRFHTRGRGWSDIGYNFLIDHHGRVLEGRYARAYGQHEVHTGENRDALGVIGAHVANHNGGSCGISMLGTFTNAPPTRAALLALKRMLAWKADRHGINAVGADPFTNANGQTRTFANVSGHGDIGQTGCPGTALHRMLPGLRSQVALRLQRGLVGYRIISTEGGIYSFGGAFDYDLGGRVANAASIAGGGDPDGFWVVDGSGRVFGYGLARDHGSLASRGVRARAVDIAGTPTGRGYWILTSDGGVFPFGDALPLGSLSVLGLRLETLKIRPTPSGKGYWVLGADGGVFSFGDALFWGSVPGVNIRTRVVDMASTRTGLGYWILGVDGGVFSFGDAKYHGSVPGLRIRWSPPARAIMATPAGDGYHVLANDGGVFSFGRVPFYGSLAGARKVPLAIAPAVQP